MPFTTLPLKRSFLQSENSSISHAVTNMSVYHSQYQAHRPHWTHIQHISLFSLPVPGDIVFIMPDCPAEVQLHSPIRVPSSPLPLHHCLFTSGVSLLTGAPHSFTQVSPCSCPLSQSGSFTPEYSHSSLPVWYPPASQYRPHHHLPPFPAVPPVFIRVPPCVCRNHPIQLIHIHALRPCTSNLYCSQSPQYHSFRHVCFSA